MAALALLYTYGSRKISAAPVYAIIKLKGASAMTIYGSRGSNELILVATKRGKPGETHHNYNGYHGIFFLDGRYFKEMTTLSEKTPAASAGLLNNHLDK